MEGGDEQDSVDAEKDEAMFPDVAEEEFDDGQYEMEVCDEPVRSGSYVTSSNECAPVSTGEEVR